MVDGMNPAEVERLGFGVPAVIAGDEIIHVEKPISPAFWTNSNLVLAVIPNNNCIPSTAQTLPSLWRAAGAAAAIYSARGA